jgi:hypothetical protein
MENNLPQKKSFTFPFTDWNYFGSSSKPYYVEPESEDKLKEELSADESEMKSYKFYKDIPKFCYKN